MAITCLLGMHKWTGCKCSVCGKTRDEDHDWSNDCEKCVRCGTERKDIHEWVGCKCSTCGKIRNESHDWSYDCKKCIRCGAERNETHKWNDCKCSACRQTHHEWSSDRIGCTRCGEVIEIATLFDLQAMTNDLAGHYHLVADINASDTNYWNNGRGFMPIGNKKQPFTGILDGNGHSIRNLCIVYEWEKKDYVGLLGYLKSGKVHNLKLVDVVVSCGNGSHVGSIVGECDQGNINECHVSGKVCGSSFVGGIVGSNSGNITECHALDEGNDARCGDFGNVWCRDHGGGLVGANYGDIHRCKSTGNIYAHNHYPVGGLVGYNSGTISECMAVGTVRCGEEEELYRLTTRLVDLKGNLNCQSLDNAVKIIRQRHIGGLVGMGRGKDSVINSYWDSQTTGKTASEGGGKGKSSAEMKRRKTFVGWDFEKTWQIDEGKSYPTLRCFAQSKVEVAGKAIPEMFAECAVTGPARCRLSIHQIPEVVKDLVKQIQGLGIQSDALIDLLNNSLMSVCPICNQYCAGKALMMMDMMKGANTVFTGNSGGFERMLEGRCLNYSCSSTEHELFWCPDLNPNDLAELNSRGIQIDPNIQLTRDHVWKPKR